MKNGDAFTFQKVNYVTFDNGARVSAHNSALEHAFVRINAVRDISFARWTSGSKILARSTDSSADWYGIWNGNSSGGTIQLNTRTTQRDNFNTSNYRKLALHELGHGFGMKHQIGNTVSVMRQGKMSYTDYSTLDKNNLNWRY